MAQRVNILPSLPEEMDPLLRRSLMNVFQEHAKQINYATGYDILRATTSQSISHDLVLGDATSADITLTLPLAGSFFDRVMRVKKTDTTTNSVKMVGSASETIDGTATVAISLQYTCLQLVSDGINWYIV